MCLLSRTQLVWSIFVLLRWNVGHDCAEAQAVERTENGVAVHSAQGVARLEVCSEDVIHVVASHTFAKERPLVPAVIRPCAGSNFTVSSDRSQWYFGLRE